MRPTDDELRALLERIRRYSMLEMEDRELQPIVTELLERRASGHVKISRRYERPTYQLPDEDENE